MAEQLDDKQLNTLKRMVGFFQDGSLTLKEAQEFKKEILEILVQSKEAREVFEKAMSQAVQMAINQLDQKHSKLNQDLRGQTNSLFVGDRIKKMEDDHGSRMKLVDDRVASVRDGGPGPKGDKGDPGEPGSPDTPGQVRSKLESLKGEDRLDIKAIRGVEEAIREVDNKVNKVSKFKIGSANYGRIMSRFMSEAPTGTIDGSNKTFYLSGAPADGSLILTRNGQPQRPGSANEYTIAGKKITMADNNKPEVDDTLWAYYERL